MKRRIGILLGAWVGLMGVACQSPGEVSRIQTSGTDPKGKAEQTPVEQTTKELPEGEANTPEASPAIAIGGGIDYLALPPALAAEAVSKAREALKARAEEIGPVDWKHTRWVVTPDFATAQVADERLERLGFRGEPEERGIRGPKVRHHRRLMANWPSVSMDGAGAASVTFSTVEEISSATLSFGEFLRVGSIETPRLRKTIRKFERVKDATGPYPTYRISFRLPSLLKKKYLSITPEHHIAWRVEIADSKRGLYAARDGRFNLRCDPAPCDTDPDNGRFVRLPSVAFAPTIDMVTPQDAIVTIVTDLPTLAAVLISDGSGTPGNVMSQAHGRRHELKVTGLKASTRYRYEVLLTDGRGETSHHKGGTFVTPPEVGSDAPVRLAFMSDSRSGAGSIDEHYCGTNRKILDQLMMEAVRQQASGVVFVGDLVDGFTTEEGSLRYQLEGWSQVTAPYGAYLPIYEAMGNHEALVDIQAVGWMMGREGVHGAEGVFADMYTNPENGPAKTEERAPPYRETVYSFDHGNIHVAVVNSNYWYRSHPWRKDHPEGERCCREGFVDDTQLAWLDADLTAARKRGQKHLIVATHEPAFPNGGHVKDAMWWHGQYDDVNAMRNRFLKVLGQHRVAALITGDEHNYSRLVLDERMGEYTEVVKHPVTQLISGGAGAPWYAQDFKTPWAKQVAHFDLRQHLIVLEARGDALIGRAVTAGGETIETFTLDSGL